MEWKFGKAQRSDFNRLNELFKEMLRTIYHTEEVEGYSEGDLDRFFEGRDEWISVAIDDHDDIIAFLSIEVHREENEFVYLDDLSVTSAYRNKGIGTKLIQDAEVYAGELNIHTIRFHVERSNTDALELYKRLGYSVEEDQGNRYLMVKKINCSDRNL